LFFDSSFAEDYPETNPGKYTPSVQKVYDFSDYNSILLTHRPIWAAKGKKKEDLLNWTLQSAFNNKIPSNVTFIVSGHVHCLQTISFILRPNQIVIGNSGVDLKGSFDLPADGIIDFSGQNAKVLVSQSFGFVTWKKSSNFKLKRDWITTFYSLSYIGKDPIWTPSNLNFTPP